MNKKWEEYQVELANGETKLVKDLTEAEAKDVVCRLSFSLETMISKANDIRAIGTKAGFAVG